MSDLTRPLELSKPGSSRDIKVFVAGTVLFLAVLFLLVIAAYELTAVQDDNALRALPRPGPDGPNSATTTTRTSTINPISRFLITQYVHGFNPNCLKQLPNGFTDLSGCS
jgi:hypothetical protein